MPETGPEGVATSESKVTWNADSQKMRAGSRTNTETAEFAKGKS